MNEYYEKIKDAKHHKSLDILNEIEGIKSVIELGCGSGRDTVFLLEKRI